MIVKVIYYDGFVNYLYTPETNAERATMCELIMRAEKEKAINESSEEIERILTNGNN